MALFLCQAGKSMATVCSTHTHTHDRENKMTGVQLSHCTRCRCRCSSSSCCCWLIRSLPVALRVLYVHVSPHRWFHQNIHTWHRTPTGSDFRPSLENQLPLIMQCTQIWGHIWGGGRNFTVAVTTILSNTTRRNMCDVQAFLQQMLSYFHQKQFHFCDAHCEIKNSTFRLPKDNLCMWLLKCTHK